ncbi:MULTISPECIES: entericidin A/B family lipoprotein [Pseudoxanthomonas]|jgi:predicted small secreted protein|nr:MULTISPECIES: entericidin A/B family lipoprotein [Pseudoxanthomonas]MCL6712289.1 entericidin A/B family lipoprotein [Pseudomonas sp. R2.Fl]UBB24556.1 entericidin A/B family lipoprotein [Pseudoxanthomonas japonensis]MBB3275649.1 putative small secreted protein [Pseudoxanthomonas sp. OG2]MBD9377232.1 entericidin A/B family lipoprotein [Pseudoxanthomonas sp. PXM04]MBV7473266.1 entericidin A/B family lipoprotein [Pseudoxanthomonas sp. PXM05]
MKRYVALLFIAMFSIAALSGCNTVKGFGKDVQKVGEKVEDASGK